MPPPVQRRLSLRSCRHCLRRAGSGWHNSPIRSQIASMRSVIRPASRSHFAPLLLLCAGVIFAVNKCCTSKPGLTVSMYRRLRSNRRQVTSSSAEAATCPTTIRLRRRLRPRIKGFCFNPGVMVRARGLQSRNQTAHQAGEERDTQGVPDQIEIRQKGKARQRRRVRNSDLSQQRTRPGREQQTAGRPERGEGEIFRQEGMRIRRPSVVAGPSSTASSRAGPAPLANSTPATFAHAINSSNPRITNGAARAMKNSGGLPRPWRLAGPNAGIAHAGRPNPLFSIGQAASSACAADVNDASAC